MGVIKNMYDPIDDLIDDDFYDPELEKRLQGIDSCNEWDYYDGLDVSPIHDDDDFESILFDEKPTYKPTKKSSNVTDKPKNIKTFYIKAVGVTYGNRQQNIRLLKTGEELELVHEINNQYDSNALLIKTKSGLEIGYVNKDYNKDILAKLNKNQIKSITVSEVTGDGYTNKGVNIKIEEYCDEVKQNISTSNINNSAGSKEHPYLPFIVIGYIALIIIILFFGT